MFQTILLSLIFGFPKKAQCMHMLHEAKSTNIKAGFRWRVFYSLAQANEQPIPSSPISASINEDYAVQLAKRQEHMNQQLHDNVLLFHVQRQGKTVLAMCNEKTENASARLANGTNIVVQYTGFRTEDNDEKVYEIINVH